MSLKPTCLFLLLSLWINAAFAQLEQCKAVLKQDTLVLENNLISRTFAWHNGELQSLAIVNKKTKQTISGNGADASISIPGLTKRFTDGKIKVYTEPATPITNAYLAAEVISRSGEVWLKRIFRIYPDCPAIACDFYLKGKPDQFTVDTSAAVSNIQSEAGKKLFFDKLLITDRISLTGYHWQARSVEFYDATDYNDNLIQTYERQLYRQPCLLKGNALLLRDRVAGEAFFILKEAPAPNSQLYYQGGDFRVGANNVSVAGLGISGKDLSETEWTKGYSVVVGTGNDASEHALLAGLRTYQQLQRSYNPADEMIVSNTWGDRNRDSRVSEIFIIKELEAAAKLGITHYQIDDGWQAGKSAASAFAGGTLTNIWANPNYWKIDTVKFPQGFSKIAAFAAKHGIQLSLWFNPCTTNSFANWADDAGVIIDNYRKYGIKLWKIDGVDIPGKLAELNFDRFINRVMAETNNDITFNFDVTASKRVGFVTRYQYGNLFLENRYTDWQSYYPYRTLRSVWQLSKYIPAQRLQIEVLNKWRNKQIYPANDPFAPSNYTFDYLFATTIIGQPLAFMELTGIPAEGQTIATFIKQFKTYQADLHKGQIFPIGNEPDGFSWTGFQSEQNKQGYFVIFREDNATVSKSITTSLPAGTKISLKLLSGNGKDFSATVGKNGAVTFNISSKNSFAVYKYQLK